MNAHEPLQSAQTVATLDRALTDIATAEAYNEWIFGRARDRLGTRVLDVGAGVGTFSALAAATGASVVACEPEPQFAAYLRDRFAGSTRIQVVEGEVEAVAKSGFDSIICFNVLEHIADDSATLRAFWSKLVRGGRLFLLVPAHPGLYGGYDRAAGHVRRYNRRDLGAKLEAAGFAVETLRHVNPIGALGWFARVRLTRRTDWPTTSFAAFDRIVPALKWLDAVPLPFGLSLWSVGRRPTHGGGAERPRTAPRAQSASHT